MESFKTVYEDEVHTIWGRGSREARESGATIRYSL